MTDGKQPVSYAVATEGWGGGGLGFVEWGRVSVRVGVTWTRSKHLDLLMGMGYLFQLEATEKKISSGEEHQDDEQPSAIPKHTKTQPARINFMSIKASSHACMPVRMWKGWLWHDTSTVQT